MVIADSRAPRDGRFIEAVGQYIPYKQPEVLTVDEERVLYWIQKGAQPTDTVRNLISTKGVMLHLHLIRKGKTEEEIATELAAWRSDQEARKAKKLPAGKQAKKAAVVPPPAPQPVAAVETPAPVVETPAPVVETPAPVVETPAPVVETPAVEAPVVETPAPVEEKPAE